MYLSHTRQDLAYALSVSVLAQSKLKTHRCCYTYFKIHKICSKKGVLFEKNSNYKDVMLYTDANWADALDYRRSTSRYFTFIGGNLITLKIRTQKVVARSNAEVKLRGMVLGLFKGLWLKLLLQE